LLVCCCCCCCWAFSCWHWATAPTSDVVPLLPVAALGLGCLVMGDIMILSFGHWILWTRDSARVAMSPPSILKRVLTRIGPHLSRLHHNILILHRYWMTSPLRWKDFR
jgi:hypothetical protein